MATNQLAVTVLTSMKDRPVVLTLKPFDSNTVAVSWLAPGSGEGLSKENWVQRHVLSNDVEALVPSGLLISTRLAKSLGHELVEFSPLQRPSSIQRFSHPDVIAISPVEQQVDVCTKAGRTPGASRMSQEPSIRSLQHRLLRSIGNMLCCFARRGRS